MLNGPSRAEVLTINLTDYTKNSFSRDRFNWTEALELCDLCASGYNGALCSETVFKILKKQINHGFGGVVNLALKVLEVCVKNCGTNFLKHADQSFFKAITKLLKLTSFECRQKSADFEVLNKIKGFLQSGPVGVATDPLLERAKRKVLWLFQLWADGFMLRQAEVPEFYAAYKALRAKGTVFPQILKDHRHLIKNAEESPAFAEVYPRDQSRSQQTTKDLLTTAEVERIKNYCSRFAEDTASIDQETLQVLNAWQPKVQNSIDAIAEGGEFDAKIQELTELIDVKAEIERLIEEKKNLMIAEFILRKKEISSLEEEKETHPSSSDTTKVKIPRLKPPPRPHVQVPRVEFNPKKSNDLLDLLDL